MTINDYEKIMKELEKEYNRNVETIKDLEEKIEIVNSNKFSRKVSRGLEFAIPPLGVMMLCSIKLVIQGIIPVNILSMLIIGVPTAIGIIGQAIDNKLNESKKSMSKFCDARTEIEKIEAETNLIIEKEKLNKKNKILKNNIKRFKEFIEASTKVNLSHNSEIIEENNLKGSQDIEESKLKLKEQYDKIDILTKRKVLSRKFYMIRGKHRAMIDILFNIILNGFIITSLAGVPFIIEEMLLNNSTLTIIQLVSTMLIGSTVTGIYSLKNYSNLKKAFNNINETLGENSLAEYENLDEELSDYDNDLEDAISLATNIELDVELEKARSKNQENSESSIEQPLTLNNVYNNSIVQEPKVKIATLRSNN